MRGKMLINVALAVLGMNGDAFGNRTRSNLYTGLTSGLKARQWHDPKRQAAAAVRREKRGHRNLRQAAAGGYGADWQAL